MFIFFLSLFIAIYPDVFFFKSSFMKRDIFRYYLPIWEFSIQNMKHGVFPLWNPYSSYGVPFFANIQSCVLYPLSVLLYWPDFIWAFNFYILLHLAMAGFFVSVWMGSCGASRSAQFVAGLAYCLGGYVMSSANVTISLCALSYFPLMLVCFRKALRQPGPGWVIGTAAVLLMQYLAGDPAIFFASILVISMTVLYEALRSWRSKDRSIVATLKTAFSIIILFLGMGAFHILLFVEFLFHSNRSVATAETAGRWSLYYNDLVSIIVPHFSDTSAFFMDYWSRQSWVENHYVGVTVMMLACVALLTRRTPMVLRHVWLAAFGLLLALGPAGGVQGILYEFFPFFKFIRYPARFMFLFSFAIACLAGFGLDALLAKLERSKCAASSSHLKKGLLLGLIMSLVGSIVAFQFISDSSMVRFYAEAKTMLEAWTKLEWTPDVVRDCIDPLISNIQRSIVYLTWILIAFWLVLTRKVRKYLILFFLTLIIFADLVEANIVEQRVEASWLRLGSQTVQRLEQERGIYRYAASPNTMQLYRQTPRYESLREALFALTDGMAPNHHLALPMAYMGSYDSIYLKEGVDLSKFYRQVGSADSRPFINMVNAKYMINSDASFSAHYPKIQNTALGDLCANEHVMPRAFLVQKALFLEKERTMPALFNASFDPVKVMYLDESAEAETSHDIARNVEERESVEIKDYALNHAAMDIVSNQDQWLFFSDAFYPGWVARVNGQKTKIYRANYAFRAIRVPAGHSKVEWNYEPILFRIGLVISLCSWVACLFGWLLKRRH